MGLASFNRARRLAKEAQSKSEPKEEIVQEALKEEPKPKKSKSKKGFL